MLCSFKSTNFREYIIFSIRTKLLRGP